MRCSAYALISDDVWCIARFDDTRRMRGCGKPEQCLFSVECDSAHVLLHELRWLLSVLLRTLQATWHQGRGNHGANNKYTFKLSLNFAPQLLW